MSKTIKVALAGAGAFGIKHLDGIKNIDGVEVVSLVSRDLEKTKEVAAKYGIAHVTTELADSLALPGLDAVILCTPTQMHAEQSIACLKAGKHVQVEIPLADTLQGAEDVVALAKQSGLVAMCGTHAVSIRAISTCTTRSRRVNSTFSKWMCRLIFSGAAT